LSTLKRLFQYSLKYWALTFPSLISMLVTAGLQLSWPQFQKLIIDRCLIHGEFWLLPYYAIGILGMFIIIGFANITRGYLSELTAQTIIYDIGNRLFNHMQRLSFSYHDEAETGQLISRSTTDTGTLVGFLGGGILNVFVNLCIALGVVVILFAMNWQLALASLWLMPFLAFVVVKYSNKVGPMYTSFYDQHGKLTSTLQQNLMGIRVVKAFAREEHEVEKFENQAKELFVQIMDLTRVGAFYGPFMSFIAAAGTTFVLWYGGVKVINGTLTLGQMIAFNTYLSLLVGPITLVSYAISIIRSAIASGDRIFEILDTKPERHLRDGHVEMRECTGHIEFQNVSFTYADGTNALHDVSFDIKPGQTVGIMGPTGSGKTSIISLIPRFYDCKAGKVLIDGRDVKEYTIGSIRRHVGIVAQENFLFGATIAQNIAYGKPTADIEQIVAAAKSADIHEFINSLPEGYDTEVGERGVNLSGGQKQRLSIARAIIKDPRILIMDDSTSAVDTETEARIQNALKSIAQSRTTIIIAQRVSSVMAADNILVLTDGRITESGTHDELLARGGRYSTIYEMQFGADAQAGHLEE